ncbi:MAG: 30S ribosomal protein S20 [Actinomycetota bacterium]
MANIKSQMKRNRQNEKRRLRNRAIRSELLTREKAAMAAVGTDNEDEALRQTIKRIDQAVSKGVLHKNTAARRKSRLVARLRAQSAGTES